MSWSKDQEQLARLTMEELQELRAGIERDPESKETSPGSIWIYNSKARRKLDAIAWAITRKLAEKRAVEGNPVPTNGYSGRQSKRR